MEFGSLEWYLFLSSLNTWGFSPLVYSATSCVEQGCLSDWEEILASLDSNYCVAKDIPNW